MLQIPTPGAALTVCVLAKNEAALLPDCLASVARLTSQVLVADTGSTDATIDIAQAAGARVARLEWMGDFSTARNAAVQHVRTPWVLMLDADERLAPGCLAALRATLTRTDIHGVWLPVHHADSAHTSTQQVVDGRRFGEPEAQLRLVRCTPDLRWERSVGEHLDRWRRQGGRGFKRHDNGIVHLGRVHGLRTHRDPVGYRAELLRLHLRARPDDADAWTLLAEAFAETGRHAHAREAALAAWGALRSREGGPGPTRSEHPAIVRAAARLADAALQDRRLADADHLLAAARAWGVHHPTLLFLEARCHEELAGASPPAERQRHLHAARTVLTACLSGPGSAMQPAATEGSTSWAARTLRARIDLQLGDAARAQRGFETVLASRPEDTAARLGLAEALIDQGAAAEGLGVVEPVLAFAGPEAQLLAGLACAQLGFDDDARWFATNARPGAVPLDAPHRHSRLADLLELAGAR